MIHKSSFYGLPFLLLLLLGSCKTTSTTTTAEHRTDSVLEVRYIERIIKDTVRIPLPIESRHTVSNTDTSSLSTSFAISVAFVDSVGCLHHSIENLPIALPVAIDRVEVVRDSIVYRDRYLFRESSKKVRDRSHWLFFAVGTFLSFMILGILRVTTRR